VRSLMWTSMNANIKLNGVSNAVPTAYPRATPVAPHP
jgi:hypothetical protein